MLAILTVGVKGDQNTVPQSLHALHNAALLCNATGKERKFTIEVVEDQDNFKV